MAFDRRTWCGMLGPFPSPLVEEGGERNEPGKRASSYTQAKDLRKQMTAAEYRLWYFLRAHRFGGVKFKRQAPVGPYIADFARFDRKLIIEVDGGQRAESARDARRDTWFLDRGFRVLRFWNNDVLKNTQGVLEAISTALVEAEAKHPSPGSLCSPPSPTRGEGTPSVRRRHSATKATRQ